MPSGLFSCAPATLAVLVFNVEYGGDLVDFQKTIEVIERAAPDVVAVEEAWGSIPRLGRELGWPEHDVRHHVVARLPLLDPPDREGFLLVETSPGCAVALANVHLPSDPSLEQARRQGGLVRAFDVERESRLRALEPTLADLSPLLRDGMPVILAGDFNTRSHLDDGLGWPTSRAVASAGLRDAWREVHPDPTTHPGFTWWAARPKVAGWNPGPDAPQTRIDRLYVGGLSRVKDVRIVGEAQGEVWPSDHRALLVNLELSPAPTPTLIAVWPPKVAIGEEIRVRARGFPGGSRVVLGEGIVSYEASIEDRRLSTSGLDPGTYGVRLLDASASELGASTVLVWPEGEGPALSLSSATLDEGEPVEVRWAGAPGNRWDWVGVYPEGAGVVEGEPLLWRHTGARVRGEVVLDEGAEGGGWPLSSGAYRLYLCEDDAYRPLASVPFTVR